MNKELEVIDWLLANDMIYRGRTRLPINSELNGIKQTLIKMQEVEKENELLKEIIKSLFDRGCPLHQYVDDKFGLTIEVDDECSIMQLGEFKGVDLNKKLEETLKDRSE